MVRLIKLQEGLEINREVEKFLLDNCADDAQEIKSVLYDDLKYKYGLETTDDLLACILIPKKFRDLIYEDTSLLVGGHVLNQDGFHFIIEY